MWEEGRPSQTRLSRDHLVKPLGGLATWVSCPVSAQEECGVCTGQTPPALGRGASRWAWHGAVAGRQDWQCLGAAGTHPAMGSPGVHCPGGSTEARVCQCPGKGWMAGVRSLHPGGEGLGLQDPASQRERGLAALEQRSQRGARGTRSPIAGRPAFGLCARVLASESAVRPRAPKASKVQAQSGQRAGCPTFGTEGAHENYR